MIIKLNSWNNKKMLGYICELNVVGVILKTYNYKICC